MIIFLLKLKEFILFDEKRANFSSLYLIKKEIKINKQKQNEANKITPFIIKANNFIVNQLNVSSQSLNGAEFFKTSNNRIIY